MRQYKEEVFMKNLPFKETFTNSDILNFKIQHSSDPNTINTNIVIVKSKLEDNVWSIYEMNFIKLQKEENNKVRILHDKMEDTLNDFKALLELYYLPISLVEMERILNFYKELYTKENSRPMIRSQYQAIVNNSNRVQVLHEELEVAKEAERGKREELETALQTQLLIQESLLSKY